MNLNTLQHIKMSAPDALQCVRDVGQYIQPSVVCSAGVGCLAVRARAHSPPGRARQGTHAARAVKIMVQAVKLKPFKSATDSPLGANTLHAAVTSFSPSDSFQTAPFGLLKNVDSLYTSHIIGITMSVISAV